ncbi:YkgJ family cysteine cluster protein [Celerinatantimonas sp. MCCC 1A17872]|uniref:YkgJ family cysteine cluster protein n=1 Tax=Celerinatantimonas sp. MCCC 1A17872 TaxID=3177514 RepID=UPI0038C386ED
MSEQDCRAGCGACCIAPSISSAIPGMPEGKPAGVRCVQLDDDNLCRLFNQSERPKVCEEFKFSKWVCSDNRTQAIRVLTELEYATQVGNSAI